MPKNNARWIAIASGGDGYITGWGGEFEPVMREIERYIYAIEEHRLGLNWKEVCAGVPALRGRAWEVSGAQPWEDFLGSLEYCFDCVVCDDEGNDGMPGQSGYSFTIELKASHRQSFLQSMGQLQNSLEKYWQRHHLPKAPPSSKLGPIS
ncbi:MAG: hypothetical protein JOY92_00720 [Verrucomicrobia bacterium]|nr:hypothetical protein [Verrucomicrobiota bacterium]